MSVCQHKHTKFQPNDEQWKCPKCGEGPDFFYIYDDTNSECELLHDQDVVICENCSFEWTGAKLAALMSKKLGMVKCKHCNGTGFVKE